MSSSYNSNQGSNVLTNYYNMIIRKTVEPVFGFFDRTVLAVEGFSMEVYRDGRFICSLRTTDQGMGQDTPQSIGEAKLRSGDVIHYVNLGPQELQLSARLTTKDRYNPSYTATVMLRINNPQAFLQCYVQNLDPLGLMKRGIEEAFQRYARENDHDRIKERDFEYAANKNMKGRRTGLWIIRTHAMINWDAQRQQMLAIERQAEIQKTKVRTQADIQSLEAMYNRQEKSRDTDFSLGENAKKQSFQRGEKLNERIVSEMENYIISLFVMEIETGFTPTQILQRHPEIAGFINTHPEIKQLINGRLQQRSSQQPRLIDQNVTDINQNRPNQRQRNDGSSH
ncbi:hypothetical protein KDA_09810 [Dictyobacter alpinus]|uniref:Uncharacterized protein n=1 Tax=Dictyobacter alpinus TaxID=2014873 RepID=A0A402B2G4_9CHLR|nr:hypothetical protein [Dictyobacter alpinus]GCE25497.1 hypothetical protein KDA_09810 [Dictyobacter alpinus]